MCHYSLFVKMITSFSDPTNHVNYRHESSHSYYLYWNRIVTNYLFEYWCKKKKKKDKINNVFFFKVRLTVIGYTLIYIVLGFAFYLLLFYVSMYMCFLCRVMSCSVDSLKFTASWKGRIQEGKLQVKVLCLAVFVYSSWVSVIKNIVVIMEFYWDVQVTCPQTFWKSEL